ncbi:MAG: SMC-Scp complex subunit ScpB [Elusimicrobia bacterium]|nr:SMC-Scp complex subunit ScpB [Elusimicrobiota bacterium]MDE2236967.1 SMC-Scp complex subunit ScpB [Elusimicrobiota bacterium]MDE2426195.1 SMC-Scp complex subunit ScpB [Elusimicrobiota bacterium]
MEATSPSPTENEALKKALESLLFITDHPLSLAQLCKILGVREKESKRVEDAIAALKGELDEKQSAVQVVEVAEGFQMGTRPDYAPYVRKLFSDRMTMRLSTAAHETLSIIAYKQPLTRAEIEHIRGVEVIAALETLLEKGLIRVVGRKETVGRPLMYGTTPDFLRHFGLRSLADLPPLDGFQPPVEPASAPAAALEAEVTTAPEPEPAPAPLEAAPEPAAPAAPENPAEQKPRKSIWDE